MGPERAIYYSLRERQRLLFTLLSSPRLLPGETLTTASCSDKEHVILFSLQVG